VRLVVHQVLRADLPQHPTSPKVARQLVGHALAGWGVADPELVDCIRLLTSEVVTNAVVHARSTAGLVASYEGGVIRIEVLDRASELPSARAAEPWATSGRGLRLVQALAQRWGSYAVSGGAKVVWFELDGP